MKYIFLSVLLTCTFSRGVAMPKVLELPSGGQKMYDATTFALFYTCTERLYSIEEISSNNFNGFSSNQPIAYEGRVREANVWIKLNVKSSQDIPTSWILKTDKLLTDVTTYIVRQNGNVEVEHSGWGIVPQKRSIYDGDVIFDFSLNALEATTIYIHIHTDLKWSSIDEIPLHIFPKTHWLEAKQKTHIFLAVYGGICLLATFYWLINFIFSRHVNYLLLIVSSLSVLLFCLDIFGVTATIWPNDPWYGLVKYGQHYIWYPSMVFSHFALSYNANSFMLHFKKPIIWCYWAFCLVTVAFLIVGPHIISWHYSHNVALLMVLLCMILGVVMIISLLVRTGFGSTGFAFLAILPLFTGVSIYILICLSLLSETYLILTPIGGLMTVVMYFYGMVHYVRILRQKRNKEILKNDRLIRNQNITLERTVEERTAELQASNAELSKTLQELTNMHERLVEIERLKANEKMSTLLKEQELKSINNMLQVQENERQRIAIDLHDRIGSMLSTIKLYFACLEEHSDAMSSDDREQYFKGIRLVDEACEDVRRISHDLASSDLVKFGLVTAIRQLGATIEGTGRLKVSVHAFAMEVRLASSVEINLYKIVQELINNILKHADASEVSIQLGRTKDELNIVVEDNGRGFDYNPDLQDTGLGLKSILLRVNKLHGQMQCDSVKKRGTITIITIPIKTAYYDKDYNS